MALLFIDGCENYVATSKWTSITGTVNYSTTEGNANTGALSFPSGALNTNQLYKRVKQSSVYNRTDSPGNVITRTSFWFKCTETITTESIFMQWREYAYSDTGVLAIGTDGKLKISNWYPSSDTSKRTYYTTTMSRIDDNAWHFIEIAQYYIGDTTGLIEIYVDELLALRRTGSNLGTGVSAPALMGDFYLGGLINGTLYIDDLIIWDENTTPDTYTGLKGPTNIYTLRPSADTSWANSTPSSGSDRFALINEVQTNFSNLVSAPINTTDLYEFTNMTEQGLTGEVYALTTSIVYSSDRPGFTSNLKIVITDDESEFLKSNTFSSFTSNIANGDTYTSTFVTDSWTANAVNSFKIGFEILR